MTTLLSKNPYRVKYDWGDGSCIYSLLPYPWDHKMIEFIKLHNIEEGEEIKERLLLTEKANSTITKASKHFEFYTQIKTLMFYGEGYLGRRLTYLNESEENKLKRHQIYFNLLTELLNQYEEWKNT